MAASKAQLDYLRDSATHLMHAMLDLDIAEHRSKITDNADYRQALTRDVRERTEALLAIIAEIIPTRFAHDLLEEVQAR